MSFRSITPENDLSLNGRMVNVVFESSETPDFSKTRIIHQITETPGLYNKVKIKHPETCRYIRYRAPEGSYCNVSEIVFYDHSGNKLDGINMGTPGSYKDAGDTGDKAFEFNAPRDALLNLCNNTIKRKGKVFFILNDKLSYYH